MKLKRKGKKLLFDQCCCCCQRILLGILLRSPLFECISVKGGDDYEWKYEGVEMS
jgi:hypothetical protein